MRWKMTDIETWDCWITKTIRNHGQKFQVLVTEYSTSTKDSWNSDRITVQVKPVDESFTLSRTLRNKIISEGMKEIFGSANGKAILGRASVLKDNL